MATKRHEMPSTNSVAANSTRQRQRRRWQAAAIDTADVSGDDDDSDDDKKEYTDVKRLWGVTKLGPLLDFVLLFSGEVDKAKLRHGDLWKDLKELMKDKAELFDTIEKDEQVEDFVSMLDTEPAWTAKEMEVGLNITAALCGAVVLSKIQAGLGHEGHLDAELEKQHVIEFKNKDGELKPIAQCTFIEKRHALRRHECGWLKANRGITIDNEPDLKVVKPQSAKLKELLRLSSTVGGNSGAGAAEETDKAV